MSWMNVTNYTPDGEALAMADYARVGVSGMGDVMTAEELVKLEARARMRKDGSLRGLTDYAQAHPVRTLVGALAGLWVAKKTGVTDVVKNALGLRRKNPRRRRG